MERFHPNLMPVLFDSKLPALQRDRLKLIPEMVVEHSMKCTPHLTNLISRKRIFRIIVFIVYTTKNLSIPLNRARRAVLDESCTYFFSRILVGNVDGDDNDQERVLFYAYFSLGNKFNYFFNQFYF